MDTTQLVKTPKAAKEIISLKADAQIIADLHDLQRHAGTLADSVAKCAADMVAQIKPLKLTIKKSVATLHATYLEELAKLDKYSREMLNAVITAKLLGDTLITVKGAKGATTTIAANKLAPSAAKNATAAMRDAVTEKELTPEQRKLADAQQRVTEAQAKEKKRTAEIATLIAKQEEAFAFCLSEGARPQLEKRLLAIGFKLAKCKATPAE